MATRQIACYIAVCDLCGQSLVVDDGELRLDTAEQAADWATSTGWTKTPEGLLVCDTVDDQAHRTVHEEAGKTVSDCAMTVTFTPEPDEPETECERGDCSGIHRSTDGYQDCDGKAI
jgi:hypothetical protein